MLIREVTTAIVLALNFIISLRTGKSLNLMVKIDDVHEQLIALSAFEAVRMPDVVLRTVVRLDANLTFGNLFVTFATLLQI